MRKTTFLFPFNKIRMDNFDKASIVGFVSGVIFSEAEQTIETNEHKLTITSEITSINTFGALIGALGSTYIFNESNFLHYLLGSFVGIFLTRFLTKKLIFSR